MNRIEQKLKDLKRQKKKALSVFLTAGYPTMSATENLVPALADSGVDFFEIGFPFSDPIADGPVIQKSSEIALKNGMTWNKVLALGKSIRKKSQTPFILMSYANPLFSRGWEKSARELSEAGFDGAIIPDLIPEEDRGVGKIFEKYNLKLIFLIAPTSSPERMRMISKASSGFVYCVSVTGVTGARKSLPGKEVQDFLKRAKKASSRPILLGFGISRPDQIRELGRDTDGFIIGSALVRALEGARDPKSLIRRAKNFIIPFVKAVSNYSR